MKGVGVDAKGNRLDPLEPLRIDRLNPEIMLCIFNGKVTDIEITQPPEDMHFGAAATKDNTYQKMDLRKLPSGDSFSLPKPVSVPMRHHRDPQLKHKRVVNIHQLANDMKDALNDAKAIDATTQRLFHLCRVWGSNGREPRKSFLQIKLTCDPNDIRKLSLSAGSH